MALSNHWEAYYFPVDGYAIARGWYRQSDALHNELLNQPPFSADQYVDWLREMGVEYIFLPRAPLDTSGPQETTILRPTRVSPSSTGERRLDDLPAAGGGPSSSADGLGDRPRLAFDRESVALPVRGPAPTS